jgi:pyruvate dehydrogenase E1 component beta subunit
VTGLVPDKEYLVPFGKAFLKKEGTDVTLVSWLSMLYRSLVVANKLETEGISVEVICPQTLVPFDKHTIIESVKKTRRLVIVEEGHQRGGVGAYIATVIGEEVFDYLDVPIKHLAALDIPIPFAHILEEYVIPGEDIICSTIKEVI